ncbi:MAG: glycine--tRNA ligase subunit alpha [candidate division WOR-3 bacterium]|nr:glycine--tRNA ligase subunit alpha [candidate division WOR-3 bacterium]MCX7836613.1 glycine--tRNA ligase subunit alpha [candidate division WOR-3 bacterium]MDW8113339.1 glycine--tRNA ligase subunit alpha [candidate division WOR-3 bacterium]
MKKKNFQDIVLTLQNFWKKQGCLIYSPYNSEVGAGTFNPATFFRVLDDKPWRVCYIEPSKRPRDGRYGKNPLRVQQYWQLQVILKPAPKDIQKIYLKSLEAIGVDLKKNDIKFIEDDWESPTLGAWGVGWQVELNGIEITQFTYFQQMGGLDLKIIPVEITYGLERIAMFLQKVFSIFKIEWNGTYTWGDLYLQNEEEFSYFNFEEVIPEDYLKLFNFYEKEAKRLLEKGLVYPGYDYVIKCSHIFNLLEARGIISVSERVNYIKRVRDLARLSAIKYLEKVTSL